MIGFNHALTGGLIAQLLPLPIALPVAFASHFLLDSLPHYGISNSRRNKSKFWKVFYTVDTIATFGLAFYAIYDQQYAIFLGGLIATMPDFIWLARVARTGSFNLSDNKSRFTRWHARIQKFERPWGVWIEIPLAAILFYIVMIKLW